MSWQQDAYRDRLEWEASGAGPHEPQSTGMWSKPSSPAAFKNPSPNDLLHNIEAMRRRRENAKQPIAAKGVCSADFFPVNKDNDDE